MLPVKPVTHSTVGRKSARFSNAWWWPGSVLRTWTRTYLVEEHHCVMPNGVGTWTPVSAQSASRGSYVCPECGQTFRR
jgi:hypothetical protein